MGTAISNAWGMVRRPSADAIKMGLSVLLAISWVAALLMAGILYAERELVWAITLSVTLSLGMSVLQTVYWCLAQPLPRKVWKEPFVGAVMHYPAIMSGVALGSLMLPGSDAANGLNWTHIAIVLVQQVALTGTAWSTFGKYLRKRIPPKRSNQVAGARTKGKRPLVVLALLALLAVVTVLAFFAGTKKGNRRRRK